jgi:hypothetical protein
MIKKWHVYYGVSTLHEFHKFGLVEVDAENCIEAMAMAGEREPNAAAIRWLADRNIGSGEHKVKDFDMNAVLI